MANIPPFLSPWLLSWFPLLQINRGKCSPIFFSLAALMVSSPADQQGQIFPHFFLPGCSHGSLSCLATGVTFAIISYSLGWALLLHINRGKYSPSFLPGWYHGPLSCWSTGVTIAIISYSLGWALLLHINRGKYSPSFLSGWYHGPLSCWSTGVTIAFISNSLRWIPLCRLKGANISPFLSP